jgi:ketosteroid isomerase-like protein
MHYVILPIGNLKSPDPVLLSNIIYLSDMIFSLTRNTVLATTIFSSALISFPSVQAKTQTSIQPIIQERYDRINAAFIRKDINAATADFTPDFVNITPDGEKQNLAQFRKHYSDLFSRFNIKMTANKTTIKEIAIKPTGAEVTIAQRTEAKVLGNKLEIDQTSRNFWLKTAQGWRLQQSRILTNQTTFNGKTFKG